MNARVARTVVVAALLAGTAIGAGARAATPCAGFSAPARGWRTELVPGYPDGVRTVTKYAVAGRTGVYVTNGRSVQRTTDGCRWSAVFSLGTWPAAYSGYATVADIAVAPSDVTSVWLALGETHSGQPTQIEPEVTRPHVLHSADSGRTWTEVSGGLDQAAGVPLELAVAASDARTAYLLLDDYGVPAAAPAVTGPRTLWATGSGGQTWSLRSRDLAANPAGTSYDEVAGFAIDPRGPRSLLVWGSSVWWSDDGGATLAETGGCLPGQVCGPYVDGEIVRDAAGARHFLALASSKVRVRNDRRGEARTDGMLGVAGTPQSMAFDPAVGLAVVTDVGSFIDTGSGYYGDISPWDLATMYDVAFAAPAGRRLLIARTADGLALHRPALEPFARYVAPTFTVPPAPTRGRLRLGAPGGVLAQPGLRPGDVTLTMTPGEVRHLPYVLDLPGHRAVDVFFLVDTSKSMDQEIAGLQRGLDSIVTALAARKVDAWFGLGEFRGYESYAYDRIVDVAPPGAELATAIGRLSAFGSANPETQLAALYQVATGQGQQDRGATIPAGLQAHFRPGALHLVVTATDERFDAAPPQPGFDVVARALRGVDAHQLGLAFTTGVDADPTAFTGPVTGNPAQRDLARMATLTDALAPPTGADCDGDGAPDIAGGQPLVCLIDSAQSQGVAHIAPAIVSLVLAMRDAADVSVVATRATQVIAAIAPAVVRHVDLKSTHLLGFDVAFTCPAGSDGTDADAMLVGVARGAGLADAIAHVRCRAPAGRTFAGPGALAVGAAGGQLPPPQPVSHAQPQPNPQANHQAQSQTQQQSMPQAGLAPNSQERYEIALASNAVRGDESLAMSRHDASPALALLGSGLIASAAGGVALRRRTRPALARARAW